MQIDFNIALKYSVNYTRKCYYVNTTETYMYNTIFQSCFNNLPVEEAKMRENAARPPASDWESAVGGPHSLSARPVSS